MAEKGGADDDDDQQSSHRWLYNFFLAAKPNGRDSLKLEINIESFGRKITRKERLSRVVAKNGR